jgi:putative methyltransferase (TIGR04325 family)
MAAGSLQYMDEGSLQRIIGSIRNPPRHVVVQRTPLHPKRSFFTLQVMAIPNNPAFCGYTVAERSSFINGMQDLGYELVDSWSQPRVLDVPFYPDCRIDTYSGLYFRLV